MRTASDVLRDHDLHPPSDAPGRYYTTCPKCSAKRSKPHQKSKVLGITIDSKGVRWGCNHCDWKDSVYFNGKANGHAEDDAIIETYDYVDQASTLLFQVCRKAGKQFLQRRPDGKGGWVWGTKDVPKVIYRLPEVIEAIAAGSTILIVEGEKDANTAWRLGLPATCNPSGAGKWRNDFNEVFRDSRVVLIPDNDEPGWKHVNDVGAHLKNVAARVCLLMLPNAKDLSAWIDSGGTREHLDELIASAPEWVAPIGDADAKTEATRQEDELIEALARMRPGVEFDRVRKRAAKQLGVSRGAIDDEIEARRSRREETIAPLYGHWAVEPWPEVADGDALLRDIIQRLRRHVICSQNDALAIALWIMFAWVHDEVARHSPILNITSAEPESGKSTVLGLISFLTPRSLPSIEISEAALFRAIKLWSPCFVIDEFDNVLASDDNVALRSVINSGHTRGQGVVRCVEPSFRPEHFTTFCPKAIGMVGRKLPATTWSRCIVVEMRRRKPDERIDKFDHKDDAVLAALRSRLLRWSTDNAEALRLAEPSMPPAFGNRRADNWQVLFAIADLAGDDWGEKARLAAMRLESANDTTTIGVRLLADIKRIFDEDGGSCMLSATMVEKLVKDEEGPWAAWNNGKGLTQNSLAVLLGGGGGRGRRSRGGFGIHSDTVHPARGTQGKGYKRAQFEDAWARYLPPEISSPFPEGGD